MSVSYGGDSIVFADGSVNSSGFIGHRNRIINGAMVIDQRNNGASITPTTDGVYSVDRWRSGLGVTSKYSVQQNAGSVTPPTGFKNYLGVTSLSAYTVPTSENYRIEQSIEGFNTADLDWGTANAATITLSFWVRSSLTGTFGGALKNSAENRAYPFTYTINSANTWEYKTITIPGDTTGTWIGATTNAGIKVSLGLGVGATLSGTAGAWTGGNLFSATGAVSVVGTNAATWYITGVQFERGSTASSFEYRSYGTELALCQRYYQQMTSGGDYNSFSAGMNVNTTETFFFNQFIVPMRSNPSVTPSTLSNFRVYQGSSAFTVTSFVNRHGGAVNGNSMNINLNTTVASGLTTGAAGMLMNAPSTTVTLAFSSEF